MHRESGERMARWADFACRSSCSLGVALGWVNPRAFGPPIAQFNGIDHNPLPDTGNTAAPFRPRGPAVYFSHGYG